MIRILDRYLLRESIVPLAIGTLAVTIMLLGGIIYDNSQLFFGNKDVPVTAVFQLLLYRFPYLFALTLPAGTVVAVSLIISRLARDTELTVMQAAGVPLGRILLPLFIGAIGVSGVNFALSETIVPRTQDAYQKLFYRLIYMQPGPLIRPNVMFQIENFSFIIGQASQEGSVVKLYDIAIFTRENGSVSTAIIAPRGVYDAGKWTLDNASVYQFSPGGEHIDMKSEGQTIINLRAEWGQFIAPKSPEAQSIWQLSKQIRDKKRQRADTRSDEVGFHAKIANPAACFFLALLSPLLAIRFSRGGSFVGVLLSIVLVFVYWNTLLLFKILGANGFLPPMLAAWSPNLLFGLCGLLLIRRSN